MDWRISAIHQVMGLNCSQWPMSLGNSSGEDKMGVRKNQNMNTVGRACSRSHTNTCTVDKASDSATVSMYSDSSASSTQGIPAHYSWMSINHRIKITTV